MGQVFDSDKGRGKDREADAPATTSIAELQDLILPPINLTRTPNDFVLRTEVVAAKLKLNELSQDAPWAEHLSCAVESALESIFHFERDEVELSQSTLNLSLWHTNVAHEMRKPNLGQASLPAIDASTPGELADSTIFHALMSLKQSLHCLSNNDRSTVQQHFPLLNRGEEDSPLERAKSHLSDAALALSRL